MMTLGSKQPGNDINFYLTPLIEDLRVLWEEGVNVDVDDVYIGDNFKMHVMLFCTVNDFLAYDNFSGYIIKKHKACFICEDDTCSHQLQNRKKKYYLSLESKISKT